MLVRVARVAVPFVPTGFAPVLAEQPGGEHHLCRDSAAMFAEAFKLEAVAAIRSDRSVSAVAAELGVNRRAIATRSTRGAYSTPNHTLIKAGEATSSRMNAQAPGMTAPPKVVATKSRTAGWR